MTYGHCLTPAAVAGRRVVRPADAGDSDGFRSPFWVASARQPVAANIRWWMVISGGLVGLAVGATLFRFAKLGGGDAKLIAALGALLGPVGLWFALFWMALAGGGLALIAAARGQRDYAYAPAIAIGFAAYLVYPGGLLP
jgi:Flp pilus assembly protein protease CpaA